MATSALRGGPRTNPLIGGNEVLTPEEQVSLRGAGSQLGQGFRTGVAGLTAGSYAGSALSAEAAGNPEFTADRDRAVEVMKENEVFAPRVARFRDIGGVGDAADWAAGALGQGGASMLPSIAAAALTRGRGVGGKALAFGGAYAPSFAMERGEAALNQYQDPELMQASAEDRNLAATAKGGVNAALESIVPAGIGSAFLRKPAGSLLGHVGRDFATEAATEGAQQGVGFLADKSIGSSKEFDPMDIVDAAAAGGVAGGGMSAAFRAPSHLAGALPDAPVREAPAPAAPAAGPAPVESDGGLPLDGGGPAGEPSLFDKASDAAAAAKERVAPASEAAAVKAKEFGTKAKDVVSDTVERMSEAAASATSPSEFLAKVFGQDVADEAFMDLSGEPNPALKGATFEETDANIQADDAKRGERAMRYADELLNDPATPESIKARVAEFGGDFSSPEAQSFVARTLVAQRGGEKIANTVAGLVESAKAFASEASSTAKSAASSAKSALGDAKDAAQDRIVRKNLQDASPAEQAAFGKVIFDGLTDEAKANPAVRRQLSDVTNALMAFAAKTGDMTAKDLPALTRLSDAMSLFADPEAMAAQIVEYANLPRTEDSFLARIKSISNAQQDMEQPNSFLVSSLTEDAKRQLTAPQLAQMAKLVDQFTVIDSGSSKRGTEIINGLAQAFGSPESARAVLDYYSTQNRANLKYDPNETLQDDGSRSINEVDAPTSSFRFKDAKSLRPFYKGSKDGPSATRDGTVGPESTQELVGYDQYVAETGKDADAEVRRLRADIESRIKSHEARKGEDRSEAIAVLKGELSQLRSAYLQDGAEAALANYEVVRASQAEQNDLKATDEDLSAYAQNTSGSRVTFTKKDGKKLMLSASSMWKSAGDKERKGGKQGGEGGFDRTRRLFKEAVASVLAREDIASLDTSLEGLELDKDGTMAERPKNLQREASIKIALDGVAGPLEDLRNSLDAAFEKFAYATKTEDKSVGEVRAELREKLVSRVNHFRERAAEAKTAPAKAVLRARMLAYRNTLERIDELVAQGEDSTTDYKESADKPRMYDETTGVGLGTKTRSASAGPDPKKAAAKNPAASSRATAKAIDDPQALSTAAMTALHDVVVKEQYDRLDTEAKVLRFVAMAVKARDQLKAIPELERTDAQDDLRLKLNDMFKEGAVQFDWDMLWDGLEPTAAQEAQMEGLLRPKAEPGSARQSTMQPKRGRPGKIDKQAIVDEIVRIRGKDVWVRFGKFAQIGASGEFSMNPDKTGRMIKIAINSLDPMSVAWHESLHDFMAMLGGTKEERKLKKDLLDAAEAPQVKAKLRELLKDHPKALEQIETDREERLAYMYQFWAEGALTLGTAGNNIFSRFAQFIREMLGVLSQEQRTDALLGALHDGKFADPSLVSAVLEDLRAQTLGDKLRAAAGPIAAASESMFTGATDRLRNTNVEALGELANMFHREAEFEGGGELPFLQRRAQQVGKRLNKLQDVLKDSTATERRQALENLQAMKDPSSKLEQDLDDYLKEIHQYMTSSGVKRWDAANKKWAPMGFVRRYFPRVWDREAVRNNKAGFMAAFTPHIGRDQAQATYDAIVNGDGSLELAENEHSLGFTPWAASVLNRQFSFIDESNAAQFAAFQSKDAADILTTYTQRAVHRAEYASSFGNNGEVITQKFLDAQKQGATEDELAMARKSVMAMEGTLGHEFNPRLKEVMSGIVTYQNIVLLPLSLFSNLIDPLGVAMRSNDMKEAFRTFAFGIKGIADQIRGAGEDAETEMARTLGLIDDQNMLEAMGHVYNSMHMGRYLRNINTKFFRYNGMEMWNQRMRVSAMVASQRFILSNLTILEAGNVRNEPKGEFESKFERAERYFKELGITEKDVFQLQDGTIALTKDQLLAAGAKKSEAEAIEKRIQAAVFKWVDSAVLRPNAAHRPLWGSDPKFQLIFHLKQFTFSFQNTILRRVGEELKHGNVAPSWILASYVPFMFLSDVMKGSLTGTLNTGADLYEIASRSIARSGILGTGVFGSDALGDIERGQLPGTSFMGPAFDHLSTLLSGASGHAGVDQVVDRSVPLMRFI